MSFVGRLPSSHLLPFLLALAASTACGSAPAPAPLAAPASALAQAPALAPTPAPAPAPTGPTPPVARRDDFHETLHGVDLVDPYRWLENQEGPETRAWIDAENAYTHALLDGFAGRDAIRGRLSALGRYDDQGTPFERGGRLFYRNHKPDDDLWTLDVRGGDKGARGEVLVDPHPLSPDHTTDIELDDCDERGTRVLYVVRRGGEDESELHVRDVRTRQDLPDVLPRALYRGGSLRPDGSGFLYALQDREKGVRVRYHAIGKPIADDREVFGEGNGKSDWVWGAFSEDGRHVVYSVSHGWAKNDLYVQTPPLTGPVVTVAKGLSAHVWAEYAGVHLVAETDLDAPNRRIVEIDPAHPQPERWRTIVPAGPDTIQGFASVGGRIVVQTLHDVTSRLTVYGLDGKMQGEIALPGLGTVRALRGQWTSDHLYVGFSSFTTPRVTLRASVAKRTTETIFRANVPFDGDAVEVKQVFYASKDGTRVPMFVLQKKGAPAGVPRPTLLYGYGGFDSSETPTFSQFVAWFVEQGGVYALANIRGGAEYGEAWHRAGMLEKKQNVFDDFIAAAEWLEANKLTDPDHLAIRGGSNGGLLVGAVMTQRPELFRAVLCEYPDLDMLGYYRFKNNNPPALLEYGDASKPEEFAFLAKYSPYQHVVQGARYPAVFLRTGDEDTRVPPLQARKMTARLQATSSAERPVVLLYDTKSGHAGGEPLGKWVEDTSLELSFLAGQLGMTVAPASAR
jgi:prolyl oligopeptidase